MCESPQKKLPHRCVNRHKNEKKKALQNILKNRQNYHLTTQILQNFLECQDFAQNGQTNSTEYSRFTVE
jgi:hypothetical protein